MSMSPGFRIYAAGIEFSSVSLEDHNFLKFTMNVNVSGSQNNWCRDALSSNSHRCLRRITTSWSTAHQLSEQGSLQARILICLYDYDQPSTPSNLKLEAPASQWVIRTAHELDAGQGSWNRRLRHHGRRNSYVVVNPTNKILCKKLACALHSRIVDKPFYAYAYIIILYNRQSVTRSELVTHSLLPRS